MTKQVVISQEAFQKFSFKTDCLDSFLYQFVVINVNYSNLWKVMKPIFIATHKQSFTERRLSINKLMSDVTMEEELSIAHNVTYDSMNTVNIDAGTSTITKKIRQLQ